MTTIKYKDRAEILSQLSDAFEVSDGLGESRFETEVIRMEGHKVARITAIKDKTPEQLAYEKYPGAYAVRELITQLRNRPRDSKAHSSANRLRDAFVEAASFGDTRRIEDIILLCKSLEQKLYSARPGSVQDDITFCFIETQIDAL